MRVRGYLDRLSWHKRHLRRKTMIASLQGNFTGKTFPVPTDPELDYFRESTGLFFMTADGQYITTRAEA